LQALLAAGAACMLPTRATGSVPAFVAAERSVPVLELLLAGTPLRAADDNKQTLVHAAARSGHAAALELLLAAHAAQASSVKRARVPDGKNGAPRYDTGPLSPQQVCTARRLWAVATRTIPAPDASMRMTASCARLTAGSPRL
jgi:hypothetical protein